MIRARVSQWFLIAMSCAVLSVAFGAATARAGVWSVDSLSPPSSPGAFLNAVSCPSDSSCAAVGSVDPAEQALSEVENQGVWTASTAPFQTFGAHPGAISCSSPTFCMAVGSTAAVWDGMVWRAVAGGSEDLDLSSVSCSGTTCVAVGSQGEAVTPAVRLWRDGVPSSIAPLTGVMRYPERVYCSSSSRCVAFGDNPCPTCRHPTFVASWNATVSAKWKPIRPRSTRGLAFDGVVSCWTLNSCTGVSGLLTIPKHRDPTKPLPEKYILTHWNGRSWHRLADIPTYDYASIACPSSASCEIVGFAPRPGDRSIAIAGHWNGHRWSSETVPVGGPHTTFRSVSCSSVSQCVAVGIGETAPLAESWRPG